MRASTISGSVLLLSTAVTLYLGCGGKVVVDAGGSGNGGAGGEATTTSTSTTSNSVTTTASATSTGTGVDCGSLAMAYEVALAQAAQCNACKNFDGCFNGPVFNDTCNCPVGVDSSQPELIGKAKEAAAAWTGAGCMPFACGKPCFAGMTWGCHPEMGDDCNGVCAPN